MVDKPAGWTSFDVVAKVRGILRQAQKQEMLGVSHLDAGQGSQEELAKRTNGTKSERSYAADAAMRQEPAGVASSAGQQGTAVRKIRVGHTGTLDPLATGLLVILIGNYTKKAEEYTKMDKVYEVTMRLGQTSTTGDQEGVISPFPGWHPGNNDVTMRLGMTSTTGDEEGAKTQISAHKSTANELQAVFEQFVGEQMQIPPQFSAIKVDGQRAYKLARAGKSVKLEPRMVTVSRLKVTRYGYPTVQFTAEVSSGTYVRSLVEDIGQKLSTGAYMTALRRTKVGKFFSVDAIDPTKINFEQIQENVIDKID